MELLIISILVLLVGLLEVRCFVVFVLALLLHHRLNGSCCCLVAVLHVVRVFLHCLIHPPQLLVQCLQIRLQSSCLPVSVGRQLVQRGQLFEMLDTCSDVDHGVGEFGVLDIGSFILVGCSGEVFLNLIKSPPFLTVGFVLKFAALQLFFQFFLLSLKHLYFVGVLGLQFLQRVGSESLCFEFLDDLISIYHTCYFFQFPEGLLIVVEFLSLVVLVMFVAVGEGGIGLVVIDASLPFGSVLIGLRNVFVDLGFLFFNVLLSHVLHSHSSLLKSFELCKCCFFGVGCVMSQQEQLLEVMFLPFETVLDGYKLAVIAHPFLFESFDHLFISLLYGLGLVVLDHNFIKSVFQNPDGPHHGVFLDVAQFVVLDLFEFVLEGEEQILLDFCLVFFFVKQYPQVVLVRSGDGEFVACGVIGGVGQYTAVLLAGNELISYGLEFFVLVPEFFYFLLVLFLDLLCLTEEESSVLLEHLVFLVLVFDFVLNGACLPDHGGLCSHLLEINIYNKCFPIINPKFYHQRLKCIISFIVLCWTIVDYCTIWKLKLLRGVVRYNKEMNKILLPEYPGNNLLFHAISHGNAIDSVNLLENKEAQVNARNVNGSTPLHIAVMIQNINIVKLLLNYDADVNLKEYHDIGEKTPLHYAIEKNNYEIASLLLDNGANTTIGDKRGLNALHYAARFGLKEMVKLLLTHGADINLRDSNGFNPAHWAKMNEFNEIVEMIGPPRSIAPNDYQEYKKAMIQIHQINLKKKKKKGKKKK